MAEMGGLSEWAHFQAVKNSKPYRCDAKSITPHLSMLRIFCFSSFRVPFEEIPQKHMTTMFLVVCVLCTYCGISEKFTRLHQCR